MALRRSRAGGRQLHRARRGRCGGFQRPAGPGAWRARRSRCRRDHDYSLPIQRAFEAIGFANVRAAPTPGVSDTSARRTRDDEPRPPTAGKARLQRVASYQPRPRMAIPVGGDGPRAVVGSGWRADASPITTRAIGRTLARRPAGDLPHPPRCPSSTCSTSNAAPPSSASRRRAPAAHAQNRKTAQN